MSTELPTKISFKQTAQVFKHRTNHYSHELDTTCSPPVKRGSDSLQSHTVSQDSLEKETISH